LCRFFPSLLCPDAVEHRNPGVNQAKNKIKTDATQTLVFVKSVYLPTVQGTAAKTKKKKTGGNRSGQMCSSFCHQKKKVSHSDVTNAVTSFSRASRPFAKCKTFAEVSFSFRSSVPVFAVFLI